VCECEAKAVDFVDTVKTVSAVLEYIYRKERKNRSNFEETCGCHTKRIFMSVICTTESLANIYCTNRRHSSQSCVASMINKDMIMIRPFSDRHVPLTQSITTQHPKKKSY
jgi:hypothetical protein